MTKRSRYERQQRAGEAERVKQIEAGWRAGMPADVAQALARDVELVRARGPLQPPPNQAPGTAPNPPRPGREPKAPVERQGRRR